MLHKPINKVHPEKPFPVGLIFKAINLIAIQFQGSPVQTLLHAQVKPVGRLTLDVLTNCFGLVIVRMSKSSALINFYNIMMILCESSVGYEKADFVFIDVLKLSMIIYSNAERNLGNRCCLRTICCLMKRESPHAIFFERD